MSTVRIKLNRSGIREAALNGPEVRAMIAEKTHIVEQAANSLEPDYEISSDVGGGTRARGVVRYDEPFGAAIEAKRRSLGRALDSARG